MAGPQLVGAEIVVHHRFPRHAEQRQQQRRGEACAVLLPAVQWNTTGRCVPSLRVANKAEAGRAAARIVAIMVGQELHHQVRAGAAVGDGAADLVADARLDVGADDTAFDTVDPMRVSAALVDAAQVDDGPHAEPPQGSAVDGE